MATDTKHWTLEELHSLPDDGNKYELVRGELFVTPAPSEGHEDILAILSAALGPYVLAQRLGMVYRPRAVVRFDGSEVEPDLMVRARHVAREKDWEGAPVPLLVVEVLSESTRRRDHEQKREFYLDVGVGEYWVIDPDRKSVRVVKPGVDDAVTFDRLAWHPTGATHALVLDLATIFAPAVD